MPNREKFMSRFFSDPCLSASSAFIRGFLIANLLCCSTVVAQGVDTESLDKGIYRLSADGQKPELVVAMAADESITSPQQSPDGKWIVYDNTKSFNENGQPTPALDHIFVVPTEGGTPKDLGAGLLPNWSPDSKQLCFAVAGGTGGDAQSGLYVMNADGSGRQRLLEAAGARWSPDGGRIAYLKSGDVHVYDILAGSDIQLTSVEQNITGVPAWSPDGKQIAIVYFSNADHTLGILQADKEQQTARALWEGHGISRSPNWSPNNSIIVYASPNKVYDIYTLEDAEVAKPMRPFEGKLPSQVKDPTWMSDGKGVLFVIWK
jgi:Tol biopolymer transport system component